jgi:hypothetical protein
MSSGTVTRTSGRSDVPSRLSGTTAFLLLCVFTVVNVVCVVLRGKRYSSRKVFFTSPGPLPMTSKGPDGLAGLQGQVPPSSPGK